MKRLWFKDKYFGWGWYPATWEGWLVLLVFFAFEYWNFMRLDEASHSNTDILRPFIIQTIIAILVLIAICYKTGEKPEWRWGGKKIK